jgi:hypothetical protein
VHLVGFTIEIYYNAWLCERQCQTISHLMGRCDINSPVLNGGGGKIWQCVHNKVDTFQQQCFLVCGVVFDDDRGWPPPKYVRI